MSRYSLNYERFWDVTQERASRDMPKPAAEQTVNGPFYVKMAKCSKMAYFDARRQKHSENESRATLELFFLKEKAR